MDTKKVKRVLTVVFAAFFTAILIVLPSLSALLQTHCMCHTKAAFYQHGLLIRKYNYTLNFTDPLNITEIVQLINSSNLY